MIRSPGARRNWKRLFLVLCLILSGWLALVSAVRGAAPQPDEGDFLIHVVAEGETLSEIAAAYGLNVADLVEANGLPDPDRIAVGQHLRVPVARRLMDDSRLPAPLLWIQAFPLPVPQGKTLSVRAVASSPVELQGWLDDQAFAFEEGPDGYWGLAGVHPLAQTGCHSLTVEVKGGGHWTGCVWVGMGDYATQRIPLSPAMGNILADQRAVQEEAQRVQAIFGRVSGGPLWRGPFHWPVTSPLEVTAPFGDRRAYGNGPPTSFHAGVDFGAPEGTMVVAPAAGRVVLAEALWVRGNAVILDHGQGLLSGYWHLSEWLVDAGEWVWPGKPLGRVGSTGLSTGPHLHWEMRLNGVPVDPGQWVEGTVAAWPTWPFALRQSAARRVSQVPEGLR